MVTFPITRVGRCSSIPACSEHDMLRKAFETEIIDDGANLIGPWRSPRQMLAEQVYDDHVSIHNDATAQQLGFKGGAIEGPTHFSQFAPLCERLWGAAWFETGCLSAHGPVATCVGIGWRIFGRHEAIRSCSEVNDLIVWFLGEGLPSVDLAHGDLS